jgi:hypothetical protein
MKTIEKSQETIVNYTAIGFALEQTLLIVAIAYSAS